VSFLELFKIPEISLPPCRPLVNNVTILNDNLKGFLVKLNVLSKNTVQQKQNIFFAQDGEGNTILDFAKILLALT
jgi:hypothetical protein